MKKERKGVTWEQSRAQQAGSGVAHHLTHGAKGSVFVNFRGAAT